MVGVKWHQPDLTDEAEATELADQLPALVLEWTRLVREGQHEKEEGQLDTILNDLGRRQLPCGFDERAMWVAALINPIPSLGVAFDLRPQVVACVVSQCDLCLAGVGCTKYETKVRDGDNGHPTIDPTFEWNQTIVLVHVYQFVWDPQTNRKAMFELQ